MFNNFYHNINKKKLVLPISPKLPRVSESV